MPMQTALMSPMFLEGKDPQGNDRLERNIAYLKYYLSIKDRLGVSAIYMIDNGSAPDKIHSLGEAIGWDLDVRLVLKQRLERTHNPNGYIYCWRALYWIKNLINLGYKKIITIDSDAYILTDKLMNHMKRASSGWEAFWCRRHNFPTAEFHILCEDAFPIFQKFSSCPYEDHDGKLMETVLPFTHINHNFYCDRSGETRDPVMPGQDLYGQMPLDMLPEILCAQSSLPEESAISSSASPFWPDLDKISGDLRSTLIIPKS